MSKGYMYDIIKRECGIISSCRGVSEKSPAEMDSRIKDEKCKIIVFREVINKDTIFLLSPKQIIHIEQVEERMKYTDMEGEL